MFKSASQMKSRRKFIIDCSAVMAVITVAPINLLNRTATSGGGYQSLEQMNYAVLAGQLNTLFRVRVSPQQVVALKLLKAPLAPPTPIRPGHRLPGDAGYEKFSLIFSGPKDALLASAIHQFEHEHLGRFEMYIGQIGMPHPDGVRYEAGFNRPEPGASLLAKTTKAT